MLGICFTQTYEDVVILKNGSEIHGIIIEQKPNEYIKIQSGENIFVYQMDEIELIKKELISDESTNDNEKNNHIKNTEKWYTYWSIGTSTPTFDDDYIKIMEDVSSPFTEVKLSMDMFSYYRHLNEKTILGFIVNATAHRIEGSFTIDNTIYTYDEQLTYYLYGLSYIKYPNIFGSGFYYRGDIGLTTGFLVSNILNESDIESYNGGLGLLAGGGYSWDLGGTRILIGAYYSTKSIDGTMSNNLQINLGGLF